MHAIPVVLDGSCSRCHKGYSWSKGLLVGCLESRGGTSRLCASPTSGEEGDLIYLKGLENDNLIGNLVEVVEPVAEERRQLVRLSKWDEVSLQN